MTFWRKCFERTLTMTIVYHLSIQHVAKKCYPNASFLRSDLLPFCCKPFKMNVFSKCFVFVRDAANHIYVICKGNRWKIPEHLVTDVYIFVLLCLEWTKEMQLQRKSLILQYSWYWSTLVQRSNKTEMDKKQLLIKTYKWNKPSKFL